MTLHTVGDGIGPEHGLSEKTEAYHCVFVDRQQICVERDATRIDDIAVHRESSSLSGLELSDPQPRDRVDGQQAA